VGEAVDRVLIGAVGGLDSSVGGFHEVRQTGG
jgi:hypothetical protein